MQQLAITQAAPTSGYVMVPAGKYGVGLLAGGNIDGQTAKAQWSPNPGDASAVWKDIATASFTALSSGVIVDLPACGVRFTSTNAGTVLAATGFITDD